MAELVQRRYAGAYYEVAKELQKEDDFLKELQYIDADSYNKILDLLSVMRKSKEITSEDYHLTKGIYKHFNSNFYKRSKSLSLSYKNSAILFAIS